MAIFADIDEQLEALRAVFQADLEASAVPAAMSAAGAGASHDVVVATAGLMKQLTLMQSCAAGVVAAHSARDAGHSGFAQRKGHRTPASLVQEITGSTRADAIKRIRVGESLLEAASVTATDPAVDEVVGSAAPVPMRALWHVPVDEARTGGRLTDEQYDAIHCGLGEPPVPDAAPDEVRDGLLVAWQTAAVQLVEEARVRTVEELRGAARAVRDMLDPEGAAVRFDQRFQRRSFRTWTDEHGQQRASLVFDDEAGGWVNAIIDTALRPRRGGPRFVDAAEAAGAKKLQDDPRTNDPLAYDLIMDVLRAGALADAETVFGTRQAGIRVVITAAARTAVSVDPELGEPSDGAVGHLEDHGGTLPAWLIAQRACDVGERTLITDRAGNPLYLGREHRLFSPRQKIALAIRDGGCRWRNCDRPASYCEGHHIDHWSEQEGRTDIDRGILLCRYHHMALHHGGWRITRVGNDDFMLHPPGGGPPVPLPPRLALTYSWAGIDPPPRRFRPAA